MQRHSKRSAANGSFERVCAPARAPAPTPAPAPAPTPAPAPAHSLAPPAYIVSQTTIIILAPVARVRIASRISWSPSVYHAVGPLEAVGEALDVHVGPGEDKPRCRFILARVEKRRRASE